ncbi:hypothetical protein [Gimesia sp.]|uniref:hypothetical protein n=1 Tax=Gimesia sp. TaxID=2024833 RepID=UPI003A93622A
MFIGNLIVIGTLHTGQVDVLLQECQTGGKMLQSLCAFRTREKLVRDCIQPFVSDGLTIVAPVQQIMVWLKVAGLLCDEPVVKSNHSEGQQ